MVPARVEDTPMNDHAEPKTAPPAPEFLQAMYYGMLRIRLFEERVAALVEEKLVETPAHLYIGQEAIALGVCSALRAGDYVFGNHRSHGHYLAKGGDMNAMMAEIFGKRSGCSSGRGGSMHLIATDVGMLGTVPIVSGTIPLAVGAALGAQLRGERAVAAVFFGDGALEEGTTHESLNLAAHRKLPVVFVCENNFYSSHLSLSERRAEDNIPDVAQAHAIRGLRVDGNDVTAVHEAASLAVERARSGAGPTLLECRTYRWRGHVGPSWDLDVGVKRNDELKQWLDRDPVAATRRKILDAGVPASVLDDLERDICQEVDAAVAFASAAPYPDQTDLLTHVFFEPEA
jgi:TPP-dependent pyruvate/acetoin dehydrogenase alpha subunit